MIASVAAAALLASPWTASDRVADVRDAKLAFTADGVQLVGVAAATTTVDRLLVGASPTTGWRVDPFDAIVPLADGRYALVGRRTAGRGDRTSVVARFGRGGKPPRASRTLASVNGFAQGPMSAAGPDGILAVAFGVPSSRRSDNRCLYRVVLVDRRAKIVGSVALARTLCGVGNGVAEPALHFAADGTLFAAFERKERRGYGIWLAERSRNGRLRDARRLGPSSGQTQIALTSDAVAWSSADGGEVQSESRVIRIATSTGGRWRTSVVDRIGPQFVGHPDGVHVEAARDGGATVAWSGAEQDGDAVRFPVRAAIVSPKRRLSRPHELAASGRVAGVAGGTVVWSAYALDREQIGRVGPLEVQAASRTADGQGFGPSELVSEPGRAAQAVAVAFDGRRGRTAVAYTLERAAAGKPLLIATRRPDEHGSAVR